MAVDTSDFKNGMAITLDGDVYVIVEFQHVKPGKGGAFVRTRLRRVRTGAMQEKTFRAGERVEPAFIDKRKLQLLYRQGENAVLMDMEHYDQQEVPLAELGSQSKFLKEEGELIALVVNDEVIGYELPNFVELAVTETDPGYKGDTVSGSSTKSAVVETGATVNVPYHIDEGDVIKIDTRTETYLERVKQK